MLLLVQFNCCVNQTILLFANNISIYVFVYVDQRQPGFMLIASKRRYDFIPFFF